MKDVETLSKASPRNDIIFDNILSLTKHQNHGVKHVKIILLKVNQKLVRIHGMARNDMQGHHHLDFA